VVELPEEDIGMSKAVDNLVCRIGALVFLALIVKGVSPLAVRASGRERPAEATEGFAALFDGRSFDGWKFEPQFAGHWVARDGVISCDGKVKVKRGGERNLWTEKEYGNFVLIVDWRLTGKPEKAMMNAFATDGEFLRDADGKVKKHEILNAGDSGIYVRGNARAQVNIWSQPMGSGDINSYHKDLKLPAEIRRACVPSKNADKPFGQWNRFVITMIGDRIWVVLNGMKVIDNALLPEVPRRGAIALQNHTDPVEFRNLYVKELE
jgi:3-keto-disaccharide hydrolase